MTKRRLAILLALASFLGLGPTVDTSAIAAEAPQQAAAKQILEASGVKGGLIVHVGCGDGALTAALQAGEGFIVQGLDTDAARVAKARELVADSGLSESVSVARFDGEHLPYADNMVNLLALDDRGKVTDAEILRALCPYGVACARSNGAWAVIMKKPWPTEMDEWSHFLHGADGNPVANDTAVAPPYHLKWEAGPPSSKSHSMLSSVQCVVSAGGRMFSISDEGPTPLPHSLPPRWTLVARDAFNGALLWERPFAVWNPINMPRRGLFPTDLFRRLVADQSRVYVTLDIFGPLLALDAATGKTVMDYKGTEGTQEAILKDGTLYLVLDPAKPQDIDRRQLGTELAKPEPKGVMAVRADTGQTLWSKLDDDTFGLLPMSLATDGKRVFFQTHQAINCLDATTGAKVWQFEHVSPYPRPGWSAPTLIAQGDVVLSADRTDRSGAKGALAALSAETGKKLWECEATEGSNCPIDLFAAGGAVWVGEQRARNQQDYRNARDLHTGEVAREMPPSEAWPNEHHHRCYRDKATSQYILAGRQGVEFLDLKSGQITPHPWIRGTCRQGIVPCNGLLYLTPHQCGCYIESKLNGFLALAPKGAVPAIASTEERLERGPAYAEVRKPQSAVRNAEDWPIHRGDTARSGYVKTTVPTALGKVWSAELGGKLTSPVCADGKVMAAQKDRNTVVCLDANSGKTLWRFVAGAAVNSPPSIADGLAVFGANDGWVYALRASDGQLAWRFRAAPMERWLVSYDRLESPWPVSGSVLVENGAVYCAAGRTSYLDGGMYMYKLELATGRPIQERNFYSRDPDTGQPVKLYEPRYLDMLPGRELPGLLPDIFSADDTNLYLRGVALNRDLVIQEDQNRPHLFSSMGLLDDTWWQRAYWIFGEHFYSGLAGTYVAANAYPSGRLLVMDDQNVYGYTDPDLARQTGQRGSGLMAASRTPTLVEDEALARKQAQKSKKYANVKPVRFTRLWTQETPFYGLAMVVAGDTLFAAGPERFDEAATAQYLSECPTNTCDPPPLLQDALAAFEGRKGSRLWAVNKADGKKLAEFTLESRPVFDGMIAAEGQLYISTTDGKVLRIGASAAGKPLAPASDVVASPSPSGASRAGAKASRGKPSDVTKPVKPRKAAQKATRDP